MMRRRLASLIPTTIRCSESLQKSTSNLASLEPLQFVSLQCSQCPVNIWQPSCHFGSVRAYSSLLALNDLRDNPGARKQKTRKGRESGRPVGLGKIAKLINAGKIDSSELITMKTLKDSGAIGKQIEDGVRLMGRGAEHIKWPIHLEGNCKGKSSSGSCWWVREESVLQQIRVRALLKPEWFEKKGRLLPKAARPPPKQKDKVDSIGRLPAPTKPIPFTTEEKEAMPASTA
ncbi:hypothetical protein DH2020_016567 [Rehmannia glutinosa]|uniref:Large ribosomal subunit protein uL15/eL18 domain-containing protein n=1 Tax=Rehmannia glutinosa TaxID=99300 RepID=A0ABR0WND1_REHGL